MQKKIDSLLERFQVVEEALARPDAFDDPKLYRELTKEHAYLSELNTCVQTLKKAKSELADNQSLLKQESDEEMRQLLLDEIANLEKKIPLLEADLENLLVPPDPADDLGVIMELRAGTGGDEAAIFVGDCVRMYQLYAQKKGWQVEPLACSSSDMGGYKEYIMAISGAKVKRFLQYEGGTHRVQRVPKTEAQGRVHTSAITIAILLEPGEEEEFKIDERDLRIDTYRSSGAGGQHVNTTDSAVRITHLPTGVVVYCQEERSQHKNKDKAMRLLKAKIVEAERKKKEEAEAAERAKQVGTGDRSERIRTYNFSQNRLTDHRINLTLYNLDHIMEGELEDVTSALVKYFYQQKLTT
ncbi:MAG: peptide chain release factor 1 [Verrucomicrobia bacterium]|nr:peptide chain release factor 1 [Verrucomicrobiota bacterium]MBS0645558.1 peptide chain release factor 1 [Verrucomicrobiota bacterium]